MKFIYTAMLLLFTVAIYGQCPSTTIILTSQAEVDAFTANYPGCTNLSNGLTINGADIDDLSTLSGISNISGDFIIQDSNQLEDLSGLIGLTTVGGDFIIDDNSSLDFLDGLDNLLSVGGNFEITGSTINNASGLGALTTISGDFRPIRLASFVGMSSLETIVGELNIQNSSVVNSFNGLSALTSIGGDFRANNSDLFSFSGLSSIISIGGSILLQNTYNLVNFSGMENLETVGGDLNVGNSMVSLTGLDGLTTIQGDFIVGTLPDITSLNGLNSLETIGGDLNITNTNIEDISSTTLQTVNGEIIISQNGSLTTIALSALSLVEQDLSIINNSALPSISGFNNLITANASIVITGNSNLTSMSPFSNLTSVAQDIVFTGNGLPSISGFPSLQSLGGTLEVTSSASLTSISGFSTLNILGALQIESNTGLLTIQGFDVLTTVTNDFTIKLNGSLLNITNFNVMSIVGGSVFVETNLDLTQINAFNSLTTTGGLEIKNNTSLQSISGLSNLTTVHGNLKITNNAALSSVNSFPNVTTLSGSLEFSTQSSVNEFEGFELLDTIGGDLQLVINGSLTNLPNFNNLTTIGGNMRFDRNNSWTNLNNLSQLTTIGGSVWLVDNPLLADIEGLNNVTSIGGSLSIEEAIITTGFDSLLTIGEDFRFDDNDGITEFNGFDSLESIGGFFSITNHGHDFEYFHGAPNLTYVGNTINVVGNLGLREITAINAVAELGNSINFYSNGDLERLELDDLVTVPGYIEYGGNFTAMEHFSFASLTSVGQHIEIEYVMTYLNFENLSTVGGDLSFEDFEGSNVESVELVMNQISSVGGNITVQGTINSLSGWNNLTSVGGNLTLDFEYNIVDLDGLQGITTIPGDLFLRGDYSSYTGLDNLINVDGNATFFPWRYGNSTGVPIEDFTGLGQLETIGGDVRIGGRLQTLNGINSLTTIGGELSIEGTNFVTDLQGLESVVSINGLLEIKNNNSLQSLVGLDSIDYNLITELIITNNSNLSFCSILPICGYIEISTETTIYNNASGCDNETEIQAACNFNTITGTLLYDFNLDGCDAADYPAGSVLVNVTNGTINYSTLTNEEGDYTLFVGEGTFTVSITPESLPENFIADPIDETVVFVGFDQVETIDFCLTATEIFDDLKISLFPLSQARPGFDASYRIIYENLGTTVQSGQISLQFDDTRMTYLESDPIQASISGNLITWNYSNLVPFQSDEILMSFNVMPPPTNQSDDILSFEAIITPVSNDVNPLDNTIAFDQIVVNSFDPNDKQVVQGDRILEAQVGDYLDYIVRFQNTGTADAITVRITDQLSDNLNFNSIRTLASSHSYRTEITNGNGIEFIFEDINLPPEASDPEGSMGYIAFQVRTNDDLQLGDIVENTASIFFDFNPPIVTNTVVTEVVEILGIEDRLETNSVRMFPNPVNDILKIETKKGVQLENVKLYSIFGRLLLETQEDQINFANRASGIYLVEVSTDAGKVVRKVIKE